MPSTIDINCDLGEETGVETAIMPYISSANIACGAHAGNEDTIRSTIQLAKEHQVVVGAHPSYPDRKNFGRVVMPIGLQPLINSVVAQIKTVTEIAMQEQFAIGHIKLHGALYNEAAKNKILAEGLVQAITTPQPVVGTVWTFRKRARKSILSPRAGVLSRGLYRPQLSRRW